MTGGEAITDIGDSAGVGSGVGDCSCIATEPKGAL
jgi:hypothetical protein